MPVEIPIIPSGGFYSSAVDMAKFIQFHINAGTTENNLISNITNKLSMIKSERKTVLTDYKKYQGNYIYSMYGIPVIIETLNVNIKDNNLYANNDILTEVKDGVFYMNSGEVLNLNKSTPTFRNIKLKKFPFGLVWYAIFIGISILSFITLPFIGLSKRNKTNTINNVKKQRLYKLLLGLNILPFIAYIIFILYFLTYSKSLASGTSSLSTYVLVEHLISILKYISVFVVIMLPTDIILNILTWKNSGWSIGEKIHYSVITIFCIIFTMLLYYFNLILI